MNSAKIDHYSAISVLYVYMYCIVNVVCMYCNVNSFGVKQTSPTHRENRVSVELQFGRKSCYRLH